MSDYGRLVSADTLEFNRRFEAGIEKVWQYLVDPEKRATWFCGGSTADHVGGAIVFAFDHRKLADSPPPEKYAAEERANFSGEILEYHPPRRLAFTWPEEYGEGTRVEITLSDAGEGKTDLRLVHSRLATKDFRDGAMAGWHAHFDLLDDIFAGREVRDFWIAHTALEEHYAQDAG